MYKTLHEQVGLDNDSSQVEANPAMMSLFITGHSERKCYPRYDFYVDGGWTWSDMTHRTYSSRPLRRQQA